MPTSTNVTNLKINELTEAQFDTAVQQGIIGANEISILTDVEAGQVIQVATLPTANADELGNIYQFVGTTDVNYTNGYFYKCVSDGQVPATYSWTAIEVQDGLPDQTGQSGKFLTTDGTDASWVTVNALQNTATGANGVGIVGTSSGSKSVVLGETTNDNGAGANVLIGYGAKANNWTASYAIGIGFSTKVGSEDAIAIGDSAESTAKRAVSIGHYAKATAQYAIQIGGTAATNSDTNTFKVANANGNFEIMSADGTIPTARLTKVNSTITLTVAGWSSNTQTVNVTGMTATGVVLVSPDPTDQADYTSAGIICSAQAAGTLTFTCSTTPAADLSVNVVML